jgi:hypothetical protein
MDFTYVFTYILLLSTSSHYFIVIFNSYPVFLNVCTKFNNTKQLRPIFPQLIFFFFVNCKYVLFFGFLFTFALGDKTKVKINESCEGFCQKEM